MNFIVKNSLLLSTSKYSCKSAIDLKFSCESVIYSNLSQEVIKIIVILIISLIIPTLSLQYLMVEMKLF